MTGVKSLEFRFCILGIVLLVLYYLPMFILGDGSYVTIHDNLDENVRAVGYAMKGHVNYDQVMGGLPSGYVASPTNVINLLPFAMPVSYWINDFLMRIAGFLGMVLLLRDHFWERTSRHPAFIYIISLLFSFIPTYTIYGLTVMGQPFLLWGFLNLSKGNRSWMNYLVIFLFAFCSSLVLSGIFVCIVLGIWWLADVFSKKKLNIPFLVGILLLGFTYLGTEYQMVKDTLAGDIMSHREEWQVAQETFISALRSSVVLGIISQYHAGSFYTLPVILAGIGVMVYHRKIERRSLMIGALILGIIFFYFINFFLIQWFSHITYLRIFHWERFYFLLPLLWFLLLSLFITQILQKRGTQPVIVCFILCGLMFGGILIKNKELAWNGKLLLGMGIKEPAYREFYAVNMFKEIADYIGKDKSSYKIGSLGIHPSIAAYNGFYTIDAYQNSYPLSYKHQFRKIIASELDKNPEIKQYFDHWGSRCYLFSAELGLNYMQREHGTISNLLLDTVALKKMGVEYIFSIAPIANHQDLGFDFRKKFSAPDSYWTIYLYQVN